jgi:hypothetical protein
MEWTRTWAHIPATIYEFPGANYQRQIYSVSSTPFNTWTDAYGNIHGAYKVFTAVEEWGEPSTAIVARSFIRVPDTQKPANMLARFKPIVPYRIIKFNDERGTEHVFEFGLRGVAEPTAITRWMGDIWEVSNQYVEPKNIGPIHGLPGAGFTGVGLPPSAWVGANGFVYGFTPVSGVDGIGGIGGEIF